MVWAPGQLDHPPVAGYIAASAAWLGLRLMDRDLVIVGYWTDWDYLNGVLERTLGEVRPSRVVVVDLGEGRTFEIKAPVLYRIGERTNAQFYHVRADGADFLARLRSEFSKSFIRRILHSGHQEFTDRTGAPANAAFLEPPALDNEDLWRVRRDLEGRLPHQPARDRVPPQEPLLGLTLLQLQTAGAVHDGWYWVLDGRRIRVLRAPNQPLHRVEAAFQRELAPAVAPDMIIAVGAERRALPSNIVRGAFNPTIARGNASRWFARTDAVQELGL